MIIQRETWTFLMQFKDKVLSPIKLFHYWVPLNSMSRSKEFDQIMVMTSLKQNAHPSLYPKVSYVKVLSYILNNRMVELKGNIVTAWC